MDNKEGRGKGKKKAEESQERQRLTMRELQDQQEQLKQETEEQHAAGADDEDEDEEDWGFGVSAGAGAGTGQGRKGSFTFCPSEEEVLVEFYREHPEFYNHLDDRYLDKTHKDKLLGALARRLNSTGEHCNQLFNFYPLKLSYYANSEAKLHQN